MALYHIHFNPVFRDFRFHEIASDVPYIDEEESKNAFLSYSKEVITPFLERLLTTETASCYLCLSHDYLVRAFKYLPDDLATIKKGFADKKFIPVLSSSHFSLVSLYSDQLTAFELNKHRESYQLYLGIADCDHFVNPFAIYSDRIAMRIIPQKVSTCFAPALDWYLKDRDLGLVYNDTSRQINLKLLHEDRLVYRPLINFKNIPPILEVDHQILDATSGLEKPIYTVPQNIKYPIRPFIGAGLIDRPMQKDVIATLRRLIQLQPEDEFLDDLAFFSDSVHFMKLNKQLNPEAYRYYIQLTNQLADLEWHILQAKTSAKRTG
ncbi:MAG: hypothetical protein LAT68_13235 [Cyclobacteriaceae bacterium]|nr:hypothetical protein [Cyclobacteriaceae bacterium]MCH8517283.1 hypothetical protein [Cyclobacteriaceae bacterium]